MAEKKKGPQLSDILKAQMFISEDGVGIDDSLFIDITE